MFAFGEFSLWHHALFVEEAPLEQPAKVVLSVQAFKTERVPVDGIYNWNCNDSSEKKHRSEIKTQTYYA